LILYKYLKKEHLLKFQKKGKIRIGTLYNYRTIEGSLQDNFEGITVYYCNPSDERVILSAEEASILFFPKKFLESFTIMPKSSVKRENTVLDSFVFCTSIVYDKALFLRWNYDAYFEIIDPRQFAKIIHDEIRLKHYPLQEYYNMRKVAYVDSKVIAITNSNKNDVIGNISNDSWEGFFKKPTRDFSIEKEFRMVWPPEPDVSIPAYIDLSLPKLCECCKFPQRLM
jgi:hypothetical protein